MIKKSQDQNRKKWRISAKRLFLTYSQMNCNMSTQKLLELLQEKPQLSEPLYVIAKELHQEGGTHFHAILISKVKFDFPNTEVLDVQHEGKIFHGNYQPIRNLQRTVKYVCKDREYITNLPDLVDGRLLSEKEFIAKQVKEKGVAKALLDYTRDHPEKAFSSQSLSALKRSFKDIRDLENSLDDEDVLESPFNIQNFHLQGTLKRWVENPGLHTSKTLVLVGKSGIGKTEFGKVFCKEKQLKTLIVNHKEDFHKIDKSYDAVIVDDANVGEFENTQLLALLDNSKTRSIRVLYQTVQKRKGVVMILLMNHAQFREIYRTLKQEAFLRRAVIHRPQQPFIVNININNQYIENQYNLGQQGNVDHNYSQKDVFDQHKHEEEMFIKENAQAARDIYEDDEFQKDL